jgi:transposase-like protein
MRQITVMSGPERRRRWSDEERLEILAEAFAPGACVADVARQFHGADLHLAKQAASAARLDRVRRGGGG